MVDNKTMSKTHKKQHLQLKCLVHPPSCYLLNSFRNHQLHQYHCPYCGFTTNDDRIGAMNLYELGKQYLNGNEKPKFKLTNVDD